MRDALAGVEAAHMFGQAGCIAAAEQHAHLQPLVRIGGAALRRARHFPAFTALEGMFGHAMNTPAALRHVGAAASRVNLAQIASGGP
jgi:hypothetical protein